MNLGFVPHPNLRAAGRLLWLLRYYRDRTVILSRINRNRHTNYQQLLKQHSVAELNRIYQTKNHQLAAGIPDNTPRRHHCCNGNSIGRNALKQRQDASPYSRFEVLIFTGKSP